MPNFMPFILIFVSLEGEAAPIGDVVLGWCFGGSGGPQIDPGEEGSPVNPGSVSIWVSGE